ncbi:hypothetical protein ABZS81_04060 [Streptomyces sp. NPDC005318]|uniref:hypothetical protein n=1 Tax=Streptomyces sp. NPDC005318 TaxID=3157031 RepID=UPI0033A8EEF0
MAGLFTPLVPPSGHHCFNEADHHSRTTGTTDPDAPHIGIHVGGDLVRGTAP